MWHLIKIVIPKITAEWTYVAYSMQYDIEDVDGIEKDFADLAKRSEKLFKNWLSTPKGSHQNLADTSEMHQRC